MSRLFKQGDPSRLRLFRGVLMNLLYTATQGDAINVDDPGTINHDVLTTALDALNVLPSSDELRNALRYLEQKEYLKVVWTHDGSGDFEAVTLLVKGMDLVERSMTDAGVLFASRR